MDGIDKSFRQAGKGDTPRKYSIVKTVANYPECQHEGCRAMKAKDSAYCRTHRTQCETCHKAIDCVNEHGGCKR